MKVKWWFFFYRTATVTDTDIYHIKDLEDYGDIVLKNIYSLHERGKQLLVLLNGFALTNVGTNSGKCLADANGDTTETLKNTYPGDFVEIEIKGGRPINIRQATER